MIDGELSGRLTADGEPIDTFIPGKLLRHKLHENIGSSWILLHLKHYSEADLK